MAKHYYVVRFFRYFKKRGFFKTIGHVFSITRRDYFQNKYILYSVDLGQIDGNKKVLSGDYSLECKKSLSDISPEEKTEIINHHSIGKRVMVNIKERFKKGAWFWCITGKSGLVGFVWSINKTPMEPYFFPLMEKDVHLFNNEVFAEYRGRGINTILINSMLIQLKKEGFQRAFIETGIWNKPEQRSLSKTFFEPGPVMKKHHRGNRVIVTWYETGTKST